MRSTDENGFVLQRKLLSSQKVGKETTMADAMVDCYVHDSAKS